MRAHHDQIGLQFTHVRHDATRYVIHLCGMHVSLDVQASGEGTGGHLVQVDVGFSRGAQVTLAVDGLGRIAFDDVEQRYRSVQNWAR